MNQVSAGQWCSHWYALCHRRRRSGKWRTNSLVYCSIRRVSVPISCDDNWVLWQYHCWETCHLRKRLHLPQKIIFSWHMLTLRARRSGVWIPVGKRVASLPKRPDMCRRCGSLCLLFSPEEKRRVVNLTTHLPRLKTSGAIPPNPLYVFKVWSRKTLAFFFKKVYTTTSL
jgi:hypothetical protein